MLKLDQMMIKQKYETLRQMVLTVSQRSPEFIVFSERGMIGWLETIGDYFIFSLPSAAKSSLRVNYVPTVLQCQTTNILTNMVFQCLAQTNQVLP